jgi:pyrroline-5-carboxylate reductase
VIGRRHGSLWLIGCGNMAGAMLRRWLATGLDPARVTVIRPSGAPAADRVRVLTAIPDEPAPDIVLLGVKPQKLHEVASPLAAAVGSETMLLSILAGVEQATLRGLFPRVGAIIRVMPNTPVAVGKGAVALFTTEARPDERHQAASLMAPLGLVEWIDDEQLFDVVAALTASGPAFVFRFIDALAEGAASLGLPGDQAQRLAVATVERAAALASASDLTPRALAEQVASPGGMTREGLNVLDAEDALRRLMESTLAAAVRRSRALGEAARMS